MATLTVRLPATVADRAYRSLAWSRRGAEAGRVPVLPRRATPVWSDLYSLQSPSGGLSMALPPSTEPAAPSGDALPDTAAAGWFDSTWDLQQGLDVAEGLPMDVPLEAWLQVYLHA